MLDALKTLVVEKSTCCRFYDIITGDVATSDDSDGESYCDRKKGKERAIPSPIESVDENVTLYDPRLQRVSGTPEDAGPSGHQLRDPGRDRDENLGSDVGQSSSSISVGDEEALDIVVPSDDSLNESQIQAIRSWDGRLSLIWGPPGTSPLSIPPVYKFLTSLVKGRERRLSLSKFCAASF